MNTRIVAADRYVFTENAGTGVEKSRVADAYPGWLFSALMTNHSASTRWLQIFDATSLPANGAEPLVSIQVPTLSTGVFDIGHAVPIRNGIVVASSSSGPTLTVETVDSAKFLIAWKRKA
ncbi:MAG TPA: hypothetical protein VFD73_12575 [Gemmatimonadales bacterium]|nr:hypothetical protein [Gemmatimonadales bacterium]